jgi:hypothetical protein
MRTELQQAGGYRVGDADRNRAAELLKEAHAAGYLTLDEIDERLSAALAARTRGELDRLVADLPPDWRARQQGGPARRRPDIPPEAVWLVPLLLLLVAMLVLGVVTRGFFFPWPLLWIWFAFGRRGWGRWPRARL